MKSIKILLLVISLGLLFSCNQQLIDKQETLECFDFWSNQDWEWYKSNIPFLETPDKDIDLTYYYRWELVTMHLVYGSPENGYASTEFIDRPWWSGAYGTISCPVGHHLYDYRWLRDPKYLRDYTKFWFHHPGAQPHNYTNWLGDAVWQGYKVHQDTEFVTGLLKGLINDYQRWEDLYWVEEEGMFAWDGMHDGMETNINSRQTPNWFAGAPGYRPTINAYMWAHANAIVNVAKLTGDNKTIDKFTDKANTIKCNFQDKCWDTNRSFFFHRFKNDEVTADRSDTIKANTLTYQSGKYEGSPHGRELMAYVPWYFNMIDDTPEFGSAWQFLMDPEFFYAKFGPTVTERNDPLFLISPRCCVWSGNSWPFATSQTLKAMSNVLNNYQNQLITKEDFLEMFSIFSITHRQDGKPYIAEALHPDNGSWDGHDVPGHSEHYYHSSYIDLVISDLIGLKPQASDSILVKPLIPDEWEYFILEDVVYHGYNVSIVWDKTGERYKKGKGFRILADGKTIASAEQVQDLSAYLTSKQVNITEESQVNYAVNNTDKYYPKAIASFPGIKDRVSKLNDGQFWYLTRTTNQWSNEYSEEEQDWAGIDFGIERDIKKIIVYFVEDDNKIKSPQAYELEYWDGKDWAKIQGQKRQYEKPMARKGNSIEFKALKTSKIRLLLHPQEGYNIAISEIEAWGKPNLPLIEPKERDSIQLGYNCSAS
ncbi:discoidin domain-containing protein [Draconibacterium sp.]|uniref:MGH1-like glycoside hydrolase domain-containing protein n=1 Tax=Draconibacterium sp. TaxID=1965318 RepID=UPI00356533DF